MGNRSKRIRPQGPGMIACNDPVFKLAAKLCGMPTRRNAPRKKKAISLGGGQVYQGGAIKSAI